MRTRGQPRPATEWFDPVADLTDDHTIALPLDDPRWVPLDALLEPFVQCTGHRDLAAHDLTKLLATPPPRGVRTMRRYYGRFRDLTRPDVEREQLPFSFWTVYALTAWSDGLRLHRIGRGVTYPIPAFGLYGWKPDFDAAIAPDRTAATLPVAPPTSDPVSASNALPHGEQIDRVYPALRKEFPPFGKTPSWLSAKRCAKKLSPHWQADNKAFDMTDPSDDVVLAAMNALGRTDN
jgi:hypothetical protein